VSDYVGKNKLVLIDFWASWCAPCRAEMPTVVKAYDLYHKKGLEIVGVSLDQNKDNWVNAIELLGQKWPQMSDLKGWDCAGAQIYGIQSIPANVLIDSQGKIVARDLRGDALLEEIESRLAAEAVAE
jgi:thiol-disulfide isomerase/thioredoxin